MTIDCEDRSAVQGEVQSFGRSYRGKCPYLSRYMNLKQRIGQVEEVKTIPICPALSIQYRLMTDRNGNRDIASTAPTWRHAGKNCPRLRIEVRPTAILSLLKMWAKYSN